MFLLDKWVSKLFIFIMDAANDRETIHAVTESCNIQGISVWFFCNGL
jgi:hypothetical protein